VFGIAPKDWDDLTIQEIVQLEGYLAALNRAS
jgi:hypothetical protein